MLHKSTGTLRYESNNKLIVLVDQSISDFYKSLIPNWVDLQPQKYPAHITVVRTGQESPNLEFWNKYDQQSVEFFYSPIIREGTVYFWLDCFSQKLEQIRIELGLSIDDPYPPEPPEGFTKKFHMTLGNKKLC